MNKVAAKILIIISSIIAILLVIFMVLAIKGNFRFPFHNQYFKEVVVDNTYANIFDSVSLKSLASDIYVRNSSDDKIRLLIYGDKEKVAVQTEGNNLVINDNYNKCNFFCFNVKLSKIEIYLPSDYEGLIKIDNDYGDIKIAEFLKTSVDIQENYGDVSLDGADDVKIDSDLGDVKILRANKAQIDVSAGDIFVNEVMDINIKEDLGDIEIAKVTNYLNVKNNCGDIKISELSINKDSVIENDLGNIEIGRTNQIYIDAHVDLGDLDIQNNYNKSDVTLKIDNNCGDIEIKN